MCALRIVILGLCRALPQVYEEVRDESDNEPRELLESSRGNETGTQTVLIKRKSPPERHR